MHPITIPNTSLQVSPICLGSASFGSQIPSEDAFAILDYFVEAGGNFIDTARVYADWLPNGQNKSEQTIGDWLSQRGIRDEVVIATKGAHPDLQSMQVSRLSPEDILGDITASLHYLNMDTIDLYWLHRDDPGLPVDEIIDVLNQQVQAGTIRYFACSNWSVERIDTANYYARENNLMGFVANQPMWSLAVPNDDAIGDKTMVLMGDADRVFHQKTGMPVIPYSSQAKGYFSKLADNRPEDADHKTYDNLSTQARYHYLQNLSSQYQISITSLVLSYLMSQPFPVIPIVGSRTIEQLKDSIESLSHRLTPDELSQLDNL